MGQMGRWVPGNEPPDGGYWDALLRDGENGQAAPPAAQSISWDGRALDALGALEAEKTASAGDPWGKAREAMVQGNVLELPVVGCNRGGVLVRWNGLRGFVPASHLARLPTYVNEDERYSEMRDLIGKSLGLKVIELDPDHSRLILSERATRSDEIRRQEMLDQLCPGDVVEGSVTNLCSFGAFVDLGGLEGLIHVSELSWGRVEHPRDVLERGQSVEVYVLNVDHERGRVGLSIKRLQPDPWHLVEHRYQAGQIVDGVITHVTDFGAFARVEEGLEGLIHVSELGDAVFGHPRSVVAEGDEVTARVINVDGERRRMGLSLREVQRPFDTG